MEDDAIITDAPVDGQQDQSAGDKSPRQNPRLSAMEALAAKLYGDDDAGSNTDEEIGSDQEPIIEPPKPQTYKVKVDGQEMELPLDEIIKGYQKDATASKRLEEAANLRKQAEQEWASINQEKAKLTQQPNAAPEDAAPPSPDEAAKRIYESLMMGDESEGIKALTELLTTGRQQPAIPDVEQVANQAAERARYQIEYNLAQKKFDQEFADIAKDPDLRGLAMSFLNQAVESSQTYDEAFSKAGAATRDWLAAKAASFGFVKPDTDSRQQKIERKQQLDTPRAANARTPAPKEEREPTPAEIVAQMRKARGLPV